MRPPTLRAHLGAASAAVMSFVLAACSGPNDVASVTADLRTQLEGSEASARFYTKQAEILAEQLDG